MKARVLIGMATCAVMLAILATVGGVTKAHADQRLSVSCNASNNGHWASAPFAPLFNNGTTGWRTVSVSWKQNCGSDGSNSVEVEVQYSTDGGLHWLDGIDINGNPFDYGFGTPASQAGLTVTRTFSGSIYCNSHSQIFRIHVYTNNGEDKGVAGHCV